MSDVIELTGPALAQAVLERRAATCGTCNRSWDDTVSTSMTPVPSGRCPFEYEHDLVICSGCDTPAEDDLCDDCFAEMPEGEWVSAQQLKAIIENSK